MSPERKNRTSQEVTVDLMLKRLSDRQQRALIGLPEFEEFQDKLIEKFQSRDNLSLDNFRKIHSQCEIEEIEAEENIELWGVDIDIGRWSKLVPLKKLRCLKHETFSNKFIEWQGDIEEAPFPYQLPPWSK